MTTQLHILDFYASPGAMTSGGKSTAAMAKLPNQVGELVRIVQGLTVHEYVASDFYHFVVPEKRKFESHIRSVEGMLDRIFALSPQPLSVSRPVDKRLIGVCHHFMLLLVAMLRAKGTPARACYVFRLVFQSRFFLKTTQFANTGITVNRVGCSLILSSTTCGRHS